jgi:hypothetical protein
MAESNEGRDYSNSSISMLFIVSSDIKKADPATRKLIRSHAMQGIKKKRRRVVRVQSVPDALPSTTSVTLEKAAEICAPALPGRVGSDLSFVEFAAEMEQSILLNIVNG